MSLITRIRQSWGNREFLGDDSRAREMAAFLPAALEIQESPPNPLAKWLGRSLITLFTIGVIWACVGKVNIVATAEGKIVPSERVKQIQPLENAAVSKILVSEGQYVQKDQPLIELDSTLTSADRDRLQASLSDTQAKLKVTEILLNWLSLPFSAQSVLQDTGMNVEYTFLDIKSASIYQQLVLESWGDYRSQLQSLQSAIEKVEAEKRAIQEIVLKLEKTLPIVTKRSESLLELLDKSFVSEAEYLEIEQERIQQQQDLASERQRLQQLQAGIKEAKERLNAFIAQTKANYLAQQSDLSNQIDQLSQEVIKAQDLNAKKILYAPVSGQVKELATHTVGGVVTEAQQLMLIVPTQSSLEMEVFLPNKDIGFVEKGMPAEIKIHTFPFTKYGIIEGEVTSISDDAIMDEKLGLIYSMRVLMKSDKIAVGNKWVKLIPGMAATAEVKTGHRRIFEYFWSPISKVTKEGLRER